MRLAVRDGAGYSFRQAGDASQRLGAPSLTCPAVAVNPSTPPTVKPFRLPRVIFGSSALGNLYEAIPPERKLAIVQAWISHGGDNVAIDSAGKYGAGLALECLGECLRTLNVPPERVTISNKLGWRRVPLVGDEPTFERGVWIDLKHDAQQCIDAQGIIDCWRQGLDLLGQPYAPRMLSVHDPDEYLAGDDTETRWRDLVAAYEALSKLRQEVPGATLGVGSKDWRVAKRISEAVQLDWVMLANCVTIYTHPPQVLDFILSLAQQGVVVVNSGVFNAGFLVGGKYFDYRLPSPTAEKHLFDWRDRFLSLCNEHNVRPAHACVQFGLSPQGVVSVALNTTNPDRVQENVEIAVTPIADDFWQEAKSLGLIDSSYPYLGHAP